MYISMLRLYILVPKNTIVCQISICWFSSPVPEGKSSSLKRWPYFAARSHDGGFPSCGINRQERSGKCGSVLAWLSSRTSHAGRWRTRRAPRLLSHTLPTSVFVLADNNTSLCLLQEPESMWVCLDRMIVCDAKVRVGVCLCERKPVDTERRLFS